MIYNMASDVETRRIVWVAQKYQTAYSSVQVAAINRKLSESLTSKSP